MLKSSGKKLIDMTENSNERGETSFPEKIFFTIQSVYGFLIIILISILLLLKATLSHNPLIEYPVDAQFGIFSLVPLEYYIALFLTFTLMVVNIWNKNKWYFYLSMLVFITVFISVESFFLYQPVGTDDAYMHLLRGAQLEITANPLLSHADGSYPYGYFGSFTFGKMISEVIGLKDSTLVPFLSFFRLIVPLVFFSFIYLLIKKFTSLLKARAVLIIMILSIPYFHFHYSPHAFGLIILPLFIYTTIVPKERVKSIYLLQILFFIFLMFSHGPTTLYVMFTYVFVLFFYFILRRKNLIEDKLNVNVFTGAFFIIGTVLTNPTLANKIPIFNTTTVTSNSLFINYSEQITNIFGLERLGNNYLLPETIRMLVIGLCGLIYLIAMYSILRKKRFDNLNLFLIGAFFSTFILSVGNYLWPSLNMTDRTFLYIEFGAIIMIIYLIQNDWKFLRKFNMKTLMQTCKKRPISILILMLLLAPAINSIAYNYNQGVYFLAPQYQERHLFLMEHTNSAIFYSYRAYDGVILENDSLDYVTFENKTFIDLHYFNTEDPNIHVNETFIVMVEPTMWSYLIQEDDASLNDLLAFADENMNKVYSSPENQIWFA